MPLSFKININHKIGLTGSPGVTMSITKSNKDSKSAISYKSLASINKSRPYNRLKRQSNNVVSIKSSQVVPALVKSARTDDSTALMSLLHNTNLYSPK